MKNDSLLPGSTKFRPALAVPVLLTLAILALLTSACGDLPAATDTADSQALYTAAAQTLVADLTLQAGNTAIAQLTELALTPAAVPPTATNTPEPSPTPSPTTTSPPPTPTATSLPCDWAEFVSDLSVPDNSSFPPGADFTKIWRIRNIGSCTWSSDYELIFTGGDLMSAARARPLPGVVRPGETVDLGVDLRAPANPGTYRGDWMLRNPTGNAFGILDNAQGTFWVQIRTVQVVGANQYAYDFVANYCLADWSNGSERLSCPGIPSNREAFVVFLERPELESRVENEPALWTRPAPGRQGWIIAEYPPYLVRNGDHFRAEIGCLYDSPDCELRFQLDYRTANGVVRNLGSWREDYDSTTTLIDLDLSNLAGLSVNFILSVNNLGDDQDANAFWFVPHIRNLVEINKVVLSWQQIKDDECNQLEIYLSSRNSGTANAYYCQERSQYVGNTTLNSSELGQVVDLYNRLISFNADVYNASTEELNYLVFSGGGNNDAVSVDIELLASLAENLFNRIAR